MLHMFRQANRYTGTQHSVLTYQFLRFASLFSEFLIYTPLGKPTLVER